MHPYHLGATLTVERFPFITPHFKLNMPREAS